MSDTERMLSSTEVARLFRVSSRTVTAWANSGRLHSVRTPGGHHRFPQSVIDAALGSPQPASRSDVAAPSTGPAIDLTLPEASEPRAVLPQMVQRSTLR